MHVRLIEVPYDSGHWGARMGRGPAALLAAGAAEALEAPGRAVEVERVSLADPFPTEVSTGFAVAREIAVRVRAALWKRRFPLVLSGNCLGAVGVLGGMGPGHRGVVWLDAHGDFHTPETTASGFVDGMALSVVAGRCFRELAAGVEGFRPIPPGRLLLAGARDVEPAEVAGLLRSGVGVVPPPEGHHLPAALDHLAREVREVYLHVDLDVLDPSEGSANGYAAPGGPNLRWTLDAIRAVRERFVVRAAALSAFDPAFDPDGRVRAAAIEVLRALAPEPAAG